MPSKEGKLTRLEQQHIKSRLSKMLRKSTCPICGSNKWTLSDMVVTPSTLGAGGGFATGAQVFPQVMFVSECGFTRYFSGSALGLAF
jgi:hypothetical protein